MACFCFSSGDQSRKRASDDSWLLTSDLLQNCYSASRIFITCWLTALGTMWTMCQFHLPRLKVTKHCEQQGELDVGQKLNLTALKKSTQTSMMVLSSVVMMHTASVFACAEMVFPHALLIWRVPSWWLFWSDILTRDRLMMGLSFLTFNMEVSFLIDWANQDFLLLLLILSMWYYYESLSFTHCVCNPAASLKTRVWKQMRTRGAKSLTSTLIPFMLPLLCW